MILAGDVGGTKTLMGLFRQEGDRLRCVHESTLPSREYRSFVALLDAFLSRSGHEAPRSATVGVAGPVVGGRSRVVNLRWPVDARQVARRLGTDDIAVINDLEATAWGIRDLPPRKLADLTRGVRSRPGNAALIAAGTGLGTALMPWDGRRWRPHASEGGHQGFAPRDDVEIDLLRFLRRRHGRVSLERALSGPSLSALYEFFAERRGSRNTGRRLEAADDPNAEVARRALAGDDPVAGKALDRFVSIYGAAAGDLALVAKATGGIYVGGGIAPKILPRLQDGAFVSAFRDKGRLTSLVEHIPVRVILEPRTALLGAARHAATLTTTRRAARPQPTRQRRR
jgi:glucokinase